ncbi:DNA polymerase III alpha subunit [Candidatus Johnevansia muelleri]|uniref:DNA polymerase III subunit alpha n=1 Tax=Candidatus Johnevansia muelleri TaxID=1495769 RepID=A0A078KHP7_9GAMM|nr:DNA polymerase III alpha subunit [Candidatus Evansia muelleri]
MPSFIHLRVHTEYSLVDGLVRIKSLIKHAKDMGIPAICVTDENNLFCLIKYYKYAQNMGIKPIIGSDIWIQNNQDKVHPYRITLIAINETGYRNLIKLISRGWKEGQFNNKAILKKKWIFESSEGLIALSGAREGEIGRLMLLGKKKAARELLNDWNHLFKDRFYLEIHRTGRPYDEECLHLSVSLAMETNIPVVATNDVRFMKRSDFFIHENRVSISECSILTDLKREKRYSEEQYFKSTAEMYDLFNDIPEALENTIMIATRCTVNLRLGKYFLPQLRLKTNTEAFLYKISNYGLEKRLVYLFSKNDYNKNFIIEKHKYYERLNWELKIINKMGFTSYFIIVMDFVRWAKKNKIIVGPGRGSGAGSLVAYAIEITNINPLEYDLLFERFLNPERISLPDFDVDFCMDNRDKVIDYVTNIYGLNSVAQIITFNTMAAKAVLRDVVRVQGKHYSLGDKLSKLIPYEFGITLYKAYNKVIALRKFLKNNEEAREIWEIACNLEGLTRGISKHAGGVVISPSELTDFAPLFCDHNGNGLVVQFDKNDIEEVGLVKFDFLGLRTLTVIDWAIKMINVKFPQMCINIDKIPLDDKKTFNMLKSGETTAIFQLESIGMKKLIRRLKPSSIEDIIALIALFRPGPLQSGMVDDFINRKHGNAKIFYPHPKYQHICLKPVLQSTYGIILYQEQVMQIAQLLAGYTLGQSDILRQAIGKKNTQEMANQRGEFIYGCIKKGIKKDLAVNIFDLLEKFAGYGFNKSHSSAYAILSYQTAWLKTHYPSQFMSAVISSEMNDIKKVVLLIHDCRRMRLNISPPDINTGNYKFSVNDNGTVLYGLGAIRGIGKSSIEAIINAREKFGNFHNLFDLCQRIDRKRLNKRTLEVLIKSGALDKLGPSRAILYANIDYALQSNKLLCIDDMFGLNIENKIYNYYASAHNWTHSEKLYYEKQTLGLYISGHPIDEYKYELKYIVNNDINNIKLSYKLQIIAGVITDIRNIKLKYGNTITIITLNDNTGFIETTIFGKLDNHNIYDNIFIVKGGVYLDEYSYKLRIRVIEIFSIFEARKRFAKFIEIQIDGTKKNYLIFNKIIKILNKYIDKHGLPIKIKYKSYKIRGLFYLYQYCKFNPYDELIINLKKLIGNNFINICYLN